jgi:CPA2 family monovalent cation:H+ antiporter-2
VLLLLTLGLGFSGEEFAECLKRHVPSAAVDFVLNATPEAVAGLLLGLGPAGVLALAGATWVSSSGIIARVLADLGLLRNPETEAVLGVLVLKDFAMAVYLPVLAVVAAGGTWWQALVGVLVAVAALLTALYASRRWGHRIGSALSHPESEQFMLRVLAITLIVAALAGLINISAAVGAFLVGLSLTGEITDRAREVLTRCVTCSRRRSSSRSASRSTRQTFRRSSPRRWSSRRSRRSRRSPPGRSRRAATVSAVAGGTAPAPR